MTQPVIKLPPGHEIGMRVVTNERYAICYARSPKRRYGTIMAGSKGNDGRVWVKLDGHKKGYALTPNLFDIVEDSKANEDVG